MTEPALSLEQRFELYRLKLELRGVIGQIAEAIEPSNGELEIVELLSDTGAKCYMAAATLGAMWHDVATERVGEAG